ncbi:hypothetical protein NliqN6_2611 [Naganishia liquefaciens]|uniref:DUF92 domain-containing protein n=1 Tax=Naganishia liquefaciens TaxID=104408 RepID=A0A8H3TU36_9TREE|nr:hypothetical protein NliqN6_2611 [Naganishia liquefaciens]
MLKLHPKAALTAGLLAGHGLRKGSLSLSGATAALAVGYGHLANDDPTFGITMIVFYALGTAATKYKANIKASFEDGHDDSSASAGKRTAYQVLCNSTPSLIASILYKFALTTEASNRVRDACYSLLGSGKYGVDDGRIARTLIFATLGHFASCLGDTLASELGILSPSKPILVTTLKPCPPGTNGGISLAGTGMSIVGGGIIGLTVGALQTQFGFISDISLLRFTMMGALAGFGGSMIDSLLGATLQQTQYDTEKGKILLDSASEEQKKVVQVDKSNTEIVSGINLLSNNQVNFVSSAAVAVLFGYIGFVSV